MVVVKRYFPKVLIVPLLYGLIIGLLVGKWWFWTAYNLNSNGPKISCLVIAKSVSTDRINASKATWLAKCDNYVVVKFNRTKSGIGSRINNENLSVVSATNSWSALCLSLRLLPKPVEWLIIAPDSLLVIVENLKKFVWKRKTVEPAYIGYPRYHYKGEFNALSSGIVLNNASLTLLLSRFPDELACEKNGKYWNNEDVLLGEYLRELGVTFEDARDEKGRGRFNGFNVNTLLSPGRIFKQTDYYKKAVFPQSQGFDCCSSDLITMDTSDADHLLMQYFLLYGIRPKQKFPKNAPMEEAAKEPRWVSALREIGYTGPTANMSSEQYYKIWEKYLPPEKLSQKLAEAAKNA